jgi:hypothetical protein
MRTFASSVRSPDRRCWARPGRGPSSSCTAGTPEAGRLDGSCAVRNQRSARASRPRIRTVNVLRSSDFRKPGGGIAPRFERPVAETALASARAVGRRESRKLFRLACCPWRARRPRARGQWHRCERCCAAFHFYPQLPLTRSPSVFDKPGVSHIERGAYCALQCDPAHRTGLCYGPIFRKIRRIEFWEDFTRQQPRVSARRGP